MGGEEDTGRIGVVSSPMDRKHRSTDDGGDPPAHPAGLPAVTQLLRHHRLMRGRQTVAVMTRNVVRASDRFF